MLRLSLSLASIILVGTTAHADTFGGWEYTAPPGYVVQVHSDHVALTKVTGASFCALAVFEARTLDGPVLAARAFEWHNVVTHQFEATVQRRTTLQTPQGVEIAATTASLVDGDGNAYGAVHYVVMPPGMIGSVLLTSTPASRRACERVATKVVRALAIDWSSPRFTDPEARVETPAGRWALAGPTPREYTFAPDGSYRLQSEATTGKRVRLVVETGTYALLGNQLTLTPRAATSTLVEAGIAKPTARPRLEKQTTYTWGKRYFADTNEWQLSLTPRRHGKLPPPTTQRYSDRVTPAWSVSGQPGV